MAFSGMVLTTLGKVLQAKVQAGVTLTFTKIKVGDGLLETSNTLEALTDLIGPQMTINIQNVAALGDGTCRVRGILTNTDLAAGFFVREIGVFANDPATGEILYSVANAGTECDYLPKGGGATAIEHVLDIITAVGSVSSITAVINQSIVFATVKDLTSSNTALEESTGYGVISGCEILAQDTPDMTVKFGTLSDNIIHMPSGKRFTPAAKSALTIAAADATNPRIDLTYIDTYGNLQYVAGTPAASPISPTVPSGCFAEYNIAVAAGATSITSANITDLRIGKPIYQNLNIVNVKDAPFFAKGDGVSNDFAAFQSARTKAGVTGVVYLPGPATYYFAGSRPDLTGCYIYAGPSVTIKMDENPNTKELKLLTPVTFSNLAGVIRRKPANVDLRLDYFAKARTVVGRKNFETYKKLFWSTDFTGTLAVGGISTFAADNTHVVTGDSVAWPTLFTATPATKGMVKSIAVGEYIEATFTKPNTTAVTKFIAAVARDATKKAFWLIQNVLAAINKHATMCFIDNEAPVVTTLSIPGNNDNVYDLINNGSVTYGIKNVDGLTAEFYINGNLVHTETFTNYIHEIGFFVTHTDNQAYTINNPISIKALANPKQVPIKIASFGDSITYGAWSAFDYPTLLADLLECTPGVGSCAVDNYAISGQVSTAQLSIMQGIDLTPYDYVTIMVGTNDVQAQVSLTTFLNNIAAMVALCAAAGAIPVIGIFPVWKQVADGNDTYQKSAIYASGLLKYCIENNLLIANVRHMYGEGFSSNYYVDNIHPNENGMLPIAATFCNTIQKDRLGKETKITRLTSCQITGDNITIYGTAAPTAGYWNVGDTVINSTPAELGTAGNKYVIEKWKCTVAGTPGTWLPLRCLTGN